MPVVIYCNRYFFYYLLLQDEEHLKSKEEKKDNGVCGNALSKIKRSDPKPSTAVLQDTGYESGLTKSQTAELLAEVHTHQQCSQLTLPNPMTGWAIEHVRASDLISKCRATMSTPECDFFFYRSVTPMWWLGCREFQDRFFTPMCLYNFMTARFLYQSLH